MQHLEGLFRRLLERPQSKEYQFDEASLKKLQEQLFKILEQKFGKYNLNLVLRYWGTHPIRHAKEDRPRTLPFDIIADIKFNIDLAITELTENDQGEENTRRIFQDLVIRLQELLYDHFVSQGWSDHKFYNLTEVHDSVDFRLSEFRIILGLSKKEAKGVVSSTSPR